MQVYKERGGLTEDHYIHTLKINKLNKSKGKMIRNLTLNDQWANELQQALVPIL